MDNFKLEAVRKFIYLGSEITSENDITKINHSRKQKSQYGLSKLMCSKIPSRAKLKLYNELILPVYDYEARTLKAEK